MAQVWRGRRMVALGSFATAEEAALCIARSSEGQAAAKWAPKRAPPPKRARVASPGWWRGPSRSSVTAVSAPASTLSVAATTAAVALAASARSTAALQQARDAAIGRIALDIIYEAAGAAANELSAEVAAEVMAGIAMGL
eukprot:scaffold61345_cov52-Phaeocystis_antarctica.AAC.3